MGDTFKFQHPYQFDPKYKKRVAYFCMEYAIHQTLKIYAGGLGFLAGSHMRSAYDLKQNTVGIGILWKYGYYDQVRKEDSSMAVLFEEKSYSFIEDTGIEFEILIHQHPVRIRAYYLPPQVFGTVPIFLLSSDLPSNDYLSRTPTFKLYDADAAAKIAANMILGIGGAKFLDIIGWTPEIYHLNEAHGLPCAFYLYNKFGNLDEVRKRMVFTTHTPEEAGNEKHDIHLLDKMSYFGGLSIDKVKEIAGMNDDTFNHTLVALRMSKKANAVSQMHGEVTRKMWAGFDGIPPIASITNAQSQRFWADWDLYEALEQGDDNRMIRRKRHVKGRLIDHAANQTGKIFDRNILTIVWARRYASYKRPDLLIQDSERFHRLITRKDKPVQIVWAGKPYPADYGSISVFNNLVYKSKEYKNMMVLVGYELYLSKLLKQGADVWLNTPRVTREASGTSGMSAAMNGAVNLSTNDGWIPEFAKHGVNSFIIPEADPNSPFEQQDREDLNNLYDILENQIIPLYYDEPKKWLQIVKQSMIDIAPYFDSKRMATSYYEQMYVG
ncbi:MAG: alpha-glucan family phosphorylase [SAR324 cluster bacterium]|uniref:Alpha-glucan family phosphorylase n=1 Tax=SAR324 cluster bacterium TaxID=2024889 RepID=A0A7X9FTN5_9DELT|nr:alpha-glucan family phosphorylase [SAR324 cluster bacterium]